MSIRLAARRIPNGRDAASIRKWAMIFLTIGIIGQSVVLNGLLNRNSITMEQLSEAMSADPTVMGLVTLTLLCKVLETCAAPLFAFLLVEGFRRTSNFEKYLLRVGALALVSEIPYNMAYSGKFLELGSRNPVFGLFICLIMLFFYGRFAEKSVKNTLMKLLISVAAFLWCMMLRIDQGICLVVLVALLWMAREKSNLRALFGFSGAMFCTVFNVYFLGSCLSCIMLHRYNDERGEQNVRLNYAFYPAVLLIAGAVGMIL